MSLEPDYDLPELSNNKWNDIEKWRNDLLPVFCCAIHLSDGEMGGRRLSNVEYDSDDKITELLFVSATSDQFRATIDYLPDYTITEIFLEYSRHPFQHFFLPTVPARATFSYSTNANNQTYLDNYTWSA